MPSAVVAEPCDDDGDDDGAQGDLVIGAQSAVAADVQSWCYPTATSNTGVVTSDGDCWCFGYRPDPGVSRMEVLSHCRHPPFDWDDNDVLPDSVLGAVSVPCALDVSPRESVLSPIVQG